MLYFAFLFARNIRAVKGSFYRAAVPQDIVDGEPTPSTWGTPVANLLPTQCDPITNFVNHSIVFGELFQYSPLALTLSEDYRYHFLRYEYD